MSRRMSPALLLLVAATAAACVTVNVYFPEAAVKDLSQQIEQEVQRQAALRAGEQPPPPPPPPPEDPPPPASGQQSSLLDLLFGVTPAHAQVAAPEITNPAIRKLIESRSARYAELQTYLERGILGESNKALLEVRNLDALTDLKARADVQRLVRAENADREELFKEIAAAKNVDLSQLDRVRATYAEAIQQGARPGTWIQDPGGSWKQK